MGPGNHFRKTENRTGGDVLQKLTGYQVFVREVLKPAKHWKPRAIFRFFLDLHLVVHSQVRIWFSSLPCLPKFHAVVLCTLFIAAGPF